MFFFFIRSKHGFIKKQQGMNFQPNFSRENACLIKSIIVFISQGEFVSHVVMLEDLYVLTSGPCAAERPAIAVIRIVSALNFLAVKTDNSVK